MKKLLLSCVFFIFSFTAFSQVTTAGLRGGVNFAQLLVTSNSSNVSATTGNLTTYAVGIFVDIKFGNISIQPALSYTGKGGRVTQDNISANIDLHYMQLPVNLVYHFPVLVGNVYIGAGPYIARGVSGKLKGSIGEDSQTEDAEFGGNGQFTTTDAGLNGILGIEFKNGFLLHFNYDLGLSNILNKTDSDNGDGGFKTRTLGLAVGFKF